MKKAPFSSASALFRILAYGAALPVIVLAAVSGCRPDTSVVGDAAIAFRDSMQTQLTMYSIALSDSMAKQDRKKARSVLQRIYSVSTPPVSEPGISLAVLDNHGVTVATMSGAETTDPQNYGNYHIVSRVIQKQKPLQSTLYLQGGRKIYIICSPLLKGEKVVGVLIIGMDAEHLKQTGVSERDFMSLSFSAPRGGRR